MEPKENVLQNVKLYENECGLELKIKKNRLETLKLVNMQYPSIIP